jgi:hypothetical protein
MIDLRLKRRGAFGLGFERPLQVTHQRAQLREAPFNGRFAPDAASLGCAFSNGLL